MKLSAPIYKLKMEAKSLKRSQGFSMTEALDHIAKREGLRSWSHLSSLKTEILPKNYAEVLDYFNQGDLIIVGARPGNGKTSFCLGLFIQAIQSRLPRSYYFSLSESEDTITKRISTYCEGLPSERFSLSLSDDICANYIQSKLANEDIQGSILVIDYLQLLDEKRSNDQLNDQIQTLKKFAREKKCIIIFLSQINRRVEDSPKTNLELCDLRLPNPLNLSLINKFIFLTKCNQSGLINVIFPKESHHQFQVVFNPSNATFPLGLQ